MRNHFFVAVVSSSLAAAFACGGGADEVEVMQEQEQQRPAERPGPEGCYIPSRTMCDCALGEEDCTEDVGVWTSGCASCMP